MTSTGTVENPKITMAGLDGHCPVCSSIVTYEFLQMASVPLHCNVLWPTRDEALRAPRGNIILTFCDGCGHIFNSAFEGKRMEYSVAYENSLHFSPHFQAYAQELVKRLIEKYHLYGKDVVEIGCGKGEFLSMLCESGGNRGFGFDPSYSGRREGRSENITFIRDFYSEPYANYTADLICCRQVLEHIQYPRDFLLHLRRSIGERLDTVVFFEVPNVLYTMRDLGIWDIIYEHCSYFSAPSLTRLFQETGFRVLQVDEAFGGQFLCLEAAPALTPCHSGIEMRAELTQLVRLVSEFNGQYQSKVKTWETNLSGMFDDGIRLVVWGAGSKGVTFLNTVKAGKQVKYVVDINLHKQDMYIAGTGQRIVAPKLLRLWQPDIILVMNPIYREEIQDAAARVGVKAEIAAV